MYMIESITDHIQLFLSFQGPTTLLMQSRASRVSDVLTLRDVDEIADSPPGKVQDAVTRKIQEEIKEVEKSGTRAPIASTDATSTVRHANLKDSKADMDKSIPVPPPFPPSPPAKE